MASIEANGVALAYEVSGPVGAPVMVLSNSLGTTRAMWDAVMPHLRGRFRVLRYDTRGHGQSARGLRPPLMEDLARDVAALLDGLALSGPVHFVGLSIGGMIGQAFTLAFPERVATLALLATGAYLPSQVSWDERAALVAREGTKVVVDATMSRWFTPGFAARAPGAVAPVREAFLAVDGRGYGDLCHALGRADLREAIKNIAVPTLVLGGRHDPTATPLVLDQLASAIPNAELVILNDAAHLVAVEQPQAVAAHLIAFLERHNMGTKAHVPGAVAFADGLRNREAVLGEEHVARSLASAGAFAGPWQDFITRTAWGEIWGDPRLPWKTRSLVVLAMMTALGREEEFKLHVRPALANGVSVPELQALLLQAGIYAGVPAANAAFRWAREMLGEPSPDSKRPG